MFKLIPTMRRGQSSGMPAAWTHYGVIDAARTGAAELLRDDRVPPAGDGRAQRSAFGDCRVDTAVKP